MMNGQLSFLKNPEKIIQILFSIIIFQILIFVFLFFNGKLTYKSIDSTSYKRDVYKRNVVEIVRSLEFKEFKDKNKIKLYDYIKNLEGINTYIDQNTYISINTVNENLKKIVLDFNDEKIELFLSPLKI